jgi:hypothetical protein
MSIFSLGMLDENGKWWLTLRATICAVFIAAAVTITAAPAIAQSLIANLVPAPKTLPILAGPAPLQPATNTACDAVEPLGNEVRDFTEQFIKHIEQTKSNGYPQSLKDAIDRKDGLDLSYIRVKTSYALTFGVTSQEHLKDINALFACSTMYKMSAADANSLGLYVPDNGERGVTYSPKIGLYFLTP